ncbi:hypothetical protein B0T22DRAFT_42084 [Podospora appendiculata]|uniref:Uncharacterized protein n=1 Tax=Podospora appendiculata TaxID=314037 RepID=A0AAE0XIC8_9PEZI|nr:hypothetical protein B0T22DRAFT_42084 [Podospora appendiculata]
MFGKKGGRNGARTNKPLGGNANKMTISTAKLERAQGFVPARKTQPQQTPVGASQANVKSAHEIDTTSRAIPMPWDLDPDYPRPKSRNTLNFNYTRDWPSLKGTNVRDELKRVLEAKRITALPPLFWYLPKQAFIDAKPLYVKAGQTERYNVYKRDFLGHYVPTTLTFVAGMPLPIGYDHRLESKNDESSLVRLLNIPEIGSLILDGLPSVRDMIAAARSCKRVAMCIVDQMEMWNFNSGRFPIDSFVHKEEECEKLGRLVTTTTQTGGIRAMPLVISPVSGIHDHNTYARDFNCLWNLLRAMNDINHSFRHVIFHQVPCLDIRLFEAMINSMPNLEKVTISQCLLFDITKLMPLLNIIKSHPRTSNGKTTYVQLDFLPFWFHGPELRPRRGTFGVVHNEPTFHAPKAVICLLLQCEKIAQEVGVDLFSDSSSVWSFVRKLPGPDPLWALKARDAIYTRDVQLKKAKEPFNQFWSQQMKDERFDAFADDLMAAVSGDGVGGREFLPAALVRYFGEDHLHMNYWRQKSRCNQCKKECYRAFFPIHVNSCWSCRMTRFVDTMEHSHLRQWTLNALDIWLDTYEISETTLKDVVTWDWETVRSPWGLFSKGLEVAKLTDEAREYYGTAQNIPVPWCSDEYEKYKPFWFHLEPPRSDNAIKERVEAASLRRWCEYLTPLKQPTDFKYGGPQYRHPCRYLTPKVGDESGEFVESRESFIARWTWTEASDRACEDGYRLCTRKKENPSDEPDVECLSLTNEKMAIWRSVVLPWARGDPGRQAFARKIEFYDQHNADVSIHTKQHMLVEQCLISMPTWPFNLDPYAITQEEKDNHIWDAQVYRQGWRRYN